MRRHAKAPSAGSTSGTGSSRGLFGRAFATRGASSDANGSGASSGRLLLTLAVACIAILLLAPAARAGKAPVGVLGTGTNGAGTGQIGGNPKGLATNNTGAGGVPAGSVYVSDATNNRVTQFTGAGDFLRTWGWDVVADGEHNTGANEQQNVTVKATGGNFTLTVVTANEGSGSVTIGSNQVTNVQASLGSFRIGDTITGTGIPAAPPTTIVGISGSTLTISANATANNASVVNLAARETTANIPATAEASQVEAALEAKPGVGDVTVSGGPGNATGTAPYQVTFSAGPLSHNDIPQMTATGVALSGGSPSSSVAVTTATAGGGYEICQAASTPTDVCKFAPASAVAGGINGAQGLAVDPATGNVFLISDTSKRVNVYSATGQFQGAFGWNVNATAPEAKLQFCTTASGCQAGSAGAGAGQFGTMTGGNSQPASPVVSPVDGHLFVPEPGNRRVSEFSFTHSGSEVTGVAFVKAFGGDVAPTVNEKQTVTLTGATGGTFGLSFNGKSTDATGSGDVEAGSNEVANFKPTESVFAAGEEVFGPGIPAGTRITAVTFDSLTLTNSATETKAGVTVSVALPFDATAAAVQGALRGLSSIGEGDVAVTGAAAGPYTVEFKGALAGTDVAQLAADASKLTGTTPSVGIATTQVGANGAEEGLESCTVATTCKAGGGDGGPSGGFRGLPGTFMNGTPSSIALDSTGSIYAGGEPQIGNCFAASVCRVQKFNSTATAAADFAPDILASTGSQPAAAVAKLIVVDPVNDHVFIAKKASSTTFKLLEFNKTGALLDTSPAGEAGIASGAGTGPKGLALGTSERAYVIQAAPPVRILGNPPAPKATVDVPIDVTQTSATFIGVAQPSAPGVEGGFATTSWFEYSTDGVSWTATVPVEIGTGAGAGAPNTCPAGNPPSCSLSTPVKGLKAGTTYLVRLVVSNGTRAVSSTVDFTTADSGPGISGLAATDVTRTTATLNGEIEPNGKSTSYHFEWGATPSYGTRVPADFEAVAGGGSAPISVSIQLSGLQPNTTYHFRIVAKSSSGTTISEDRELLTLNAAGLPSNRGFELVSPADKKPAGSVESFLGYQLFFQGSEKAGTVVYPIFNSLEDSSAGGVSIFNGTRSGSGWSTAQISPPALVNSPIPGETFGSRTGAIRYISPDQRCALVETHNPLTADTPAVDLANGVQNLYRWNAADGSYTLITKTPPLDPDAPAPVGVYYEVLGVTEDCSKVFFKSIAYAFSPGVSRLYEWDEGVLRDAGVYPNGEVASGIPFGIGKWVYTVSPTSGRLFFTATSNSGDPLDNGKNAVFVRKGPGQVVNASKPTNGATFGATYEGASPDGSHVFFLANYGIAASPSNGPTDEPCGSITEPGMAACDLYDYDVETGTLTDVSATTAAANPRGAVALGVLDISADGETVYFAARGQLVPGEGRTYAQNIAGTMFANIYRYHDGELSYVGALDNRSMASLAADFQGALRRNAYGALEGEWVSQTTRNGDYLLFTSRDDITGTNPQRVRMAYLYSAADDTTVCVSCPKGRAPRPGGPALIRSMTTTAGFGGNYVPRSLSEDGRVFFASEEALIPGAIEGSGEGLGQENNIYEWHRGRLSLLTSGRTQLIDLGGPNAEDVYVRSYDRLNSQDFDFAGDLYDIRMGGGFSAPSPPPSCDAAADQCQGTPGTPPSAPTPPSANFNGPGSSTPDKPTKPKKCPKGKVLKHGKCVKKPAKQKKQKKGKAQSKRAASNNLGGAK